MALISDMVVRITANTKSLTSSIHATSGVITELGKTAENAAILANAIDEVKLGNVGQEVKSAALEIKTLDGVAEVTRGTLVGFASATYAAAAACGILASISTTILGTFSAVTVAIGGAASRVSNLSGRFLGLSYAVSLVTYILKPFVAVVSFMLSVVRMVVGPLASMAIGAMKLYVAYIALCLPVKWFTNLVVRLSPKMRILLGTLLAMSVGMRVMGGVGRLAARAMSLLIIPIVALRSPTMALSMVTVNLSAGFGLLRAAATQAAMAVRYVGTAAAGAVKNGFGKLRDVVTGSLTSLKMMAGLIGGAVVIGVVKLAARAETLRMQFTVLTGSIEKANQLMKELDDFAAKTPFQKMEIGQAARQLLAFGSNADGVISELRVIGDIAAGTGIPIGELAELYGKARVQGRLFGEDINQLQGRGIPIVQDLAKQFGVTEAEVKKMVEHGKVGFPDMQQAMIAMTGPGGQFGGMMANLSTTTAGKFSTFVDLVVSLGEKIGTAVLPHAMELMDWASGMVDMLGQSGVGGAFLTALQSAKAFVVGVFNGLHDVGTVAGVIAGNYGQVWEAMFEELPKYAAAAFNWIKDNAAITIENLKTMAANVVENVAAGATLTMQAAAFALGVGDMPNMQAAAASITPMAPLKPFAPFNAPELGVAAKDIGQQIAAALAANEAHRMRVTPPPDPTGAIKELIADPKINLPGDNDKNGPPAYQKTVGGALEKGSQEAYSAIVNSARASDQQLKATQSITSTLRRDVARPLQQMAANRPNVVEAFT